MKASIFALLIAVLGISPASFADKDKSGPSDERLEKMRQELQLSDEQVSEIRRIRDEGGSREDVRGVLTEEQQAKAKQARAGKDKDKGKKKDKGGKKKDKAEAAE